MKKQNNKNKKTNKQKTLNSSLEYLFLIFFDDCLLRENKTRAHCAHAPLVPGPGPEMRRL